VLEAGLRQCIDDLDLAARRNRTRLDLKAFARPFLVDTHRSWKILHDGFPSRVKAIQIAGCDCD
jgi:hypothetical protein